MALVIAKDETSLSNAKKLIKVEYELLEPIRNPEEAAREGLGVFSLDGKMVDLPIINRAIHTLDIARLIGLID